MVYTKCGVFEKSISYYFPSVSRGGMSRLLKILGLILFLVVIVSGEDFNELSVTAAPQEVPTDSPPPLSEDIPPVIEEVQQVTGEIAQPTEEEVLSQPSTPATIFTKPMFSINLMGKELRIYQDDYILALASSCGSITENWKEFYEFVVKPGDYVVDINAGFGWSFIHLAETVGSNGVAVGISLDSDTYNLLRENVNQHAYWNRTMIAQTGFYSNFNAGQSVMGDIFRLLQGNCPKLITSRRLLGTEPNMLEVLADSTEALYRCFPIIYIDTNDLDMLANIVHSLSLSSYNFYIQKLGCNCINKDSFKNRVGFIGIVDSFRTDEVKEFLSNHTIQVSTASEMKFYGKHLCDPPEGLSERFQALYHREKTESIPSNKISILPWSEEEQAKYLSLETITVDLDVITDPYSPLRCFWDHLDLRIESAAFEFYIDRSILNGTYRASATLQCTSWINTLLYTSIQRYVGTQKLETCGLDYGQIFYYGSIISQNCKDFTLRRLELLLHMFLNRKFSPGIFPDVQLPDDPMKNRYKQRTMKQAVLPKKEESAELPTESEDVPEQTANDTTASEPSSSHPDTTTTNDENESLVKYFISTHFYNISHAFSMYDWFERDVFQAKYEPEHCGEPIFCGLTQEFQRRLFLWQHPPRYIGDRKFPTFPYFHSMTGITRTCENVRYLVFEPATRLNGIGSFIELIGSALRLAICLDRVLILNVHDQSGSYLKWRHYGCAGNTIECYFQPISSCVLPDDLSPKGNESTHAGDFHLYPFKLERVLYLKGLPDSDICSLCNSRWPKDSTFFNGLFVMDNPYKVEYFEQPNLVHAAAFMEAIRLPYMSQNLRFLLRPRPWLREMVGQIVRYAMASPVLVATVDDDDENTGNDNSNTTEHTNETKTAILPPIEYHPMVNQKYSNDPTFNLTSQLVVKDFPQYFLSLHVRWGMKHVEVSLEPLTRYMTFITKKFPHIKDIFISTETQRTILTLTRDFPQFRFHYLHYQRSEFIDLRKELHEISGQNPFVYEFLFSMANLYVASEADGFVGTLTSNWCVMIEQLERTRGDGGYDYYSMDRGSAFSTCF